MSTFKWPNFGGAYTDTIKTETKNSKIVSLDTTSITKSAITKISVLVLPPYDAIANEGITPNINNYLTSTLIKDTTLKVLIFPYRQLMNVSYQNVFDKKYCTQIRNKIKTDIIIMSKIDQVIGTGNMSTDKWNFKIKIYNTKTGNQTVSNLTAENLTSSEIENLILSKQQDLFTEIKSNR